MTLSTDIFLSNFKKELLHSFPGFYDDDGLPDMQMLKRHGCLPFFASEMCRSGPQELKEMVFLNSARYLRLSRELGIVVTFLESEDIVAIPFKGVIWKELLYPQVPFRQFADIDLYIPSSHLKKAVTELARAGYFAFYNINTDNIDTLINNVHSLEFKHRDHNTYLDVHWHLAEGYCSVPYKESEFKKRFRNVQIDKSQLSVFDPEIMLFLIVIHGAKNSWSRLIHLVDLASFINTYPETDWSAFAGKLEKMGMSRMLWTGIELLKRLFNIDLPPVLHRSAQSSHSFQNLVDSLYQRLMNGNGAYNGKREIFKLNLRLREGLREKLKYVKFRAQPKKVDLFQETGKPKEGKIFTRRLKRVLES